MAHKLLLRITVTETPTEQRWVLEGPADPPVGRRTQVTLAEDP